MLLDVLSKHFVFGGHSEGGDFANDVSFFKLLSERNRGPRTSSRSMG